MLRADPRETLSADRAQETANLCVKRRFMRPGNGVWDEAAKEGNLDKEALWELREGHDSEKAGKPLGSN